MNFKKILAIVICVTVIIAYSLIMAALGFKHNGGIIPMAILFFVIAAIWKFITKGNESNDKNENQE